MNFGSAAARLTAITGLLVTTMGPGTTRVAGAQPASPPDTLRKSCSCVSKGALIGAGVGVLIGAGAWFVAASHGGEVVPPLTTPLVYGAIGTFVGAAIGAGNRHDPGAKAKPAAPPRPAHDKLAVGERVRLTAPPDESIVGQIVGADSSRLTLAVASKNDTTQCAVEWNELTSIERSNGYKSRVGTGVLIGATFGALVGLGGAVAGADDSRALLTAPLALAGVGVLVGAAIGGAASGEKWSPMPLDTRVGVAIGPGHVPMLAIRTTF